MLFINLLAPNVEVSGEVKSEYVKNNETPGYIIKEFNNKVAIFAKNEKEKSTPMTTGNNVEKPIKILNILVKDLPIEDQNLLKNGIIAESEHELDQIIEDYSS